VTEHTHFYEVRVTHERPDPGNYHRGISRNNSSIGGSRVEHDQSEQAHSDPLASLNGSAEEQMKRVKNPGQKGSGAGNDVSPPGAEPGST